MDPFGSFFTLCEFFIMFLYFIVEPCLNVNINDVSSDVENAKYKNVVYFNKDCHKGQWVRQGESASHDS